MKDIRRIKRIARHKRIRRTLNGTSSHPRLTVFRSHKEIYAQVIDDVSRTTLCSASSIDKDLRKKCKDSKPLDVAKLVGKTIAKRALKKGVKGIVFDRGGYKYHGRIKAFAEAVRKGGLIF